MTLHPLLDPCYFLEKSKQPISEITLPTILPFTIITEDVTLFSEGAVVGISLFVEKSQQPISEMTASHVLPFSTVILDVIFCDIIIIQTNKCILCNDIIWIFLLFYFSIFLMY